MTEEENPVARLIKTYCQPHLPHFVVAIFSMLAARLLWFYPPVVIGVIFDAVLIGNEPYDLPLIPSSIVPTGQMDQFLFSVGVITAAYVLGVLIYLVGSWLRALAAYRVQHELRTDTYEWTQQLGYEFFENREKGELISIINNDVNQLESYLNGTLQLTGNVVFILIAVAAYMLILNWQLALLAFLAPAIIALFNYAYSRYIEPKYQRLRGNVGDITSRIENNISGIGVIKAYTQEEFELSRIEELSKQYRDISWTVSRARIALGQVTGQLSNFGYVLILFIGGLWVLSGPPLMFSGDLAAGTLLAFLIYNDLFTWPLSQITTIVDRYQGMKASSRRVFSLLDEEPKVGGSSDAVEPTIEQPSIMFNDVSFRYEGSEQDAVSDISFKTDPHDTVGIIGPTGAGKSTLLKLLFRFYDPDDGAIRIDSMNIRNIMQRSYREAIGYVSQNPYLFAGTVTENIAYGATDSTHEEIVEAAKLASAHEFIVDLDDGYDTEVGEGGSQLSGGQRQRIAIARAVVGDPEIMILDEATSDVDNETKIIIQQSLRAATENRTTFVVAHNLSTVRNADEILVLDDGQIVEHGNHDKLVAEDGLYADLWRLQTGDFESISGAYGLTATH